MTSPPLISWLGAVFTTLTGGRLVFWVMDLNPDEALAAGWLRPGAWTTRRLSGCSTSVFAAPTTVVALDRFMAKRIENKGIAAAKIVTLPPWPHDDEVTYDREGRESSRLEHGLTASTSSCTRETTARAIPCDTLLEAARALRDRTDIHSASLAAAANSRPFSRFALDNGLSNIITVPYQPADLLGASFSSADLHVVVMGDQFVGLVHPCKVYNIRKLGIPYLYIGPAESHVTDMAPTFSAAHDDVESVVRHVEEAARPACATARGGPTLSPAALGGADGSTSKCAAFSPVASQQVLAQPRQVDDAGLRR